MTNMHVIIVIAQFPFLLNLSSKFTRSEFVEHFQYLQDVAFQLVQTRRKDPPRDTSMVVSLPLTMYS
jgi:hypothetical protein